MMRKIYAANQKLFEAITEKLQQILESFRKIPTSIEVKLADMEKAIVKNLVKMREKINNLQSQTSEPVRVVSESNARIKPPFLRAGHPYPCSCSSSKQ